MARIRAHPGEVLREEFMKPLGLSANALALALRIPATRIGDILRIEKPLAVKADTAIRLARYFYHDRPEERRGCAEQVRA
jgi:addiction module HigA family antidote